MPSATRPSAEDDSVDDEFRELFPHKWERAGIDAERLAVFPPDEKGR